MSDQTDAVRAWNEWERGEGDLSLTGYQLADAAITALQEKVAALEAEVERLKSFEIYEVFTAADGEPATRPVNWPEKVAELEAFKRDVCRRASQDQHGWSAWVAGWQRREDS